MWSKTVGLRTRPLWDQKIDLGLGLGLGLAGLVLCGETRSCHARRHNDLEGHSNFSSTIYSFFSILCLERHYCGDQQLRSLTEKSNPPNAFVYFQWSWSWSCYFGLGLMYLVLFTSLLITLIIYMLVGFCFRYIVYEVLLSVFSVLYFSGCYGCSCRWWRRCLEVVAVPQAGRTGTGGEDFK